MKIVFFEVEEWEKEYLKSQFPEASFETVKLDASTVSNYADAQVVSTFIYSAISKEVIDSLPQLKAICTRSTGFDHIDVTYAKSKGITVCNVPEYGSVTVAEHTFALMLNLTRKIYNSVCQTRNLDFHHSNLRGVDVFGKTLGIIGVGKIGRHVCRIANGFGMNVLAYNRSEDEELKSKYGVKYVDLSTLLSTSDVISLHLPLNEQTKHIINMDNIHTFKKGSYLINTARGGLIQTEALMTGLNESILAGAGLDVVEEEKQLAEEAEILTTKYSKEVDMRALVCDHILINHPNVILTPHNAFNSTEAVMRIAQTTAENIQAFINSKPVHIVP